MWLWGPSLILIGLLAELSSLAGHVRMLLIALAIFGVLKAESLRAWLSTGQAVPFREKLLWFMAWPGFDPVGFFCEKTDSTPLRGEWVLTAIKTLCGLFLWLGAAPALLPESELAAGWVAMTGIVLTVHFGLLHLVTLFWRACGRNVTPLMNAPLRSTSLSDFWGRRWNTAFRDFTHHSVFRPAARKWDAATASWLSFVFSGLIHELAISVPAGGGYGLPLAYFLLQGTGIWLERALSRHGFAVRGGVRGWACAVLFLVPASPMLFHRPFIHDVIVPLILT